MRVRPENIVHGCAGPTIFAPVKCEESTGEAGVPRPRNGESTVDMAMSLGKPRRVVGLRMADVEDALSHGRKLRGSLERDDR